MCKSGANRNPGASYRFCPTPPPPPSYNRGLGGLVVEKPPFEIASKSATTDWAHQLRSSGGLITIVVMTLFNISQLLASDEKRLRDRASRSQGQKLAVAFCMGNMFRADIVELVVKLHPITVLHVSEHCRHKVWTAHELLSFIVITSHWLTDYHTLQFILPSIPKLFNRHSYSVEYCSVLTLPLSLVYT